MKNKKQTIMKFNTSQLDNIIVTLLNVDSNKFVSNVEKLFTSFNENSYKNDFEKEVRIRLIEQIIDSKIKNQLKDKDTIIGTIRSTPSGKFEERPYEILDELQEKELSENEIEFIDSQISNLLKYSIVSEKSDDLLDKLTNFKADNYEDFYSFITNFSETVNSFNKELVSAGTAIKDSKSDISFGDEGLVSLFKEMIDDKKNPSTKIKTGIERLNELFNGGFERERVYLALGLAKGWKSGFLLNAAIWAIKYNALKPKNPNLRPVVVYLTQENTIKETVDRIWSHYFGNDSKMEENSPEEVARYLQTAGLYNPNNVNEPALIIMHRSTKSINTADLNAILDDLEKEGKECVFLVQDYIKRMRSTVNHKEIRFELSIISDEFKTIAKDRGIPILTAMQLNREAYREYEAAEQMNQQIAAIGKMGTANVGESLDLIQNVDYAFILGRSSQAIMNDADMVENYDRFLTIKLIASRGKPPKFTSISHRFRDGNDMSLIEDINLSQPLSIINTEQLVKATEGNLRVAGSRRVDK